MPFITMELSFAREASPSFFKSCCLYFHCRFHRHFQLHLTVKLGGISEGWILGPFFFLPSILSLEHLVCGSPQLHYPLNRVVLQIYISSSDFSLTPMLNSCLGVCAGRAPILCSTCLKRTPAPPPSPLFFLSCILPWTSPSTISS